MKDWKLIIIIALCIVASIMGSLWYRANQVIELKAQIEKTEDFLKTARWNKQTGDFLRNLGYDIPEPVVQAQPQKSEGDLK